MNEYAVSMEVHFDLMYGVSIEVHFALIYGVSMVSA